MNSMQIFNYPMCPDFMDTLYTTSGLGVKLAKGIDSPSRPK